MLIEKLMPIETILKELGLRIEKRRLDMQLTQAKLAEEAGLSKRTVERIESGETSQLSSFIRVLGALDLITGLEYLVPKVELSPIELIELKGKRRKRATTPINKSTENQWNWED